MNKRILALALAALMSVSMASVAFADETAAVTGTPVVTSGTDATIPGETQETPASTQDEIKNALSNFDIVYVNGKHILLTEDLDGKNKTIIDVRNGGSSTFLVTGDVTIKNVSIQTGSGYAIQAYGPSADVKLENVNISGGEIANVLANGGKVTVSGGKYESGTYGAVEYGLGEGLTKLPEVNVNGAQGVSIYVGSETLTAIQNQVDEYKDKSLTAIRNDVEEKIKDGSPNAEIKLPEVPDYVVTSEEELIDVINKAGEGSTVQINGKIDLTKQLVINKDLKVVGGSIDATGVNDHAAGSVGGGAIVISGANVDFTDVDIQTGNSARYVIQYYNASGTLDRVNLTGGEYWTMLVNGGDVIVTDSSVGSIDFAAGTTGTPKLTVTGNSTVVKVNIDDPDSLGLKNDASLSKSLKKYISSEIELTTSVKFDDGKVEVPVEPEVPDERDDRENNGGDYFGNAKWAEVKREIAAAEEGDVIEMSATGLPWFPSSVARALKGKDITLEVRKNGVTYSINGLEIGSVDKIWYEFDQIETELLTVEVSEDK